MRRERLTAEQFDAVVKHLPKRMRPQTIAVARSILVGGMEVKEAVDYYGLTKQRVGHILDRVMKAHREVPPSWEKVEVYLPPEMAAVVREMEKSAKRAHSKGGDNG